VTVAAVVLAATPESAIADADGLPSVRRIADIAWSGGATPIVVVSADPDGAVARALAGSSVTLAEPAPTSGGPVAQIRRGLGVAATVIHETTAAFVWPARLTWVGAETVTSMIEAHGIEPSAILRPTYGGDGGWPVLVPLDAAADLASIDAGRDPDEIVGLLMTRHRSRLVDLGDPGTVFDRGTPSGALPRYDGPPEPAAPHAHEWGAALADAPEDEPLAGPSLAPFGQAEDS